MKKFLKWTGIVLGALVLVAFCAFLYFIPPFTLVPPEQFIEEETHGLPNLAEISDPKERMVAEHGRDLVVHIGCTGCHTPQGGKGPKPERYLAGGMQFADREHGSFTTRNLTPDPATGLARYSDQQVLRILSTGLNTEGRIIPHRLMPWGAMSHLTAEDRYAILTFLRHLNPVRSGIPEPQFGAKLQDPNAAEEFAGVDHGKP